MKLMRFFYLTEFLFLNKLLQKNIAFERLGTLNKVLFPCFLLFFSCYATTTSENQPAVGNSVLNEETNLFAEEPHRFRLSEYRGKVPKTLKGGKVIDIEEAKNLFDEGNALFIDALYYNHKPKNLSEEALWIPKVRKNIKGSIWLANTGRGVLSEKLETYFLRNLKEYTGGNFNKKIVFYCLPNCWLSWNAGKRAILNGYKQVYWFPGGTVAWEKKNYPFQISKPLHE